ncbi:hypothetical protein POX_e06160 [Penicillium oxalicum]|uniref:Uncharacterized protein n=1 Tax=Penicillium oxalicum (strain 114-2 / CGMCC 5302) TaxID=933388 RepID=S8AYX1_PENO1|nr:hypothetical protein POX_e06160 [Penicillium oxalicum]EPS27182.1 hypothetical protein PDE_02125 [Penicillium oxalicum 114-2]KAI2788148.1 hypothetical protein POX_e06160 [Penicillium oxalicum]
MRSSVLIGLFAALCNSAHGLVFRDNIIQVVDGKSLYLLHDVESARIVRLGDRSYAQGWEFNTDGLADDEAVITSLNSNNALVCPRRGKCKLDLDGSKQTYRVVQVDTINHIFTFQDLATKRYVSRRPDLSLELTDHKPSSIYFQLEKIQNKAEQPELS